MENGADSMLSTLNVYIWARKCVAILYKQYMFKCSSDFDIYHSSASHWRPVLIAWLFSFICDGVVWCWGSVIRIKINFYYISLIFWACIRLVKALSLSFSIPLSQVSHSPLHTHSLISLWSIHSIIRSTHWHVCKCIQKVCVFVSFKCTFQHLLHINVLTCECIT